MHTAIYSSNILLNINVMSTAYDLKNQNLPESYIKKMKSIPHVKAISPCLMIFTYFKESEEVINIWGVDLTNIKEFRNIGNISSATLSKLIEERTAALAGKNIMDRYAWNVGDKIILKSRLKNVEIPFTIREVMSDYGDAGNLIYINLRYAQDIIGSPGQLSWIALKAEDYKFIPEVSQKAETMFRNYPVEVFTYTEKSFMDSIIENLKAILFAFNIICWVTIISNFFLVFNSMTMSIQERVVEIGIMKVLGFSKSKILGFIITETVLVAGLGGMVGSYLAYLVLIIWRINIPTGTFPLKLIPNLNLVWYGILISILIGFLSGFFPAINGTRIKISDAMRKVV